MTKIEQMNNEEYKIELDTDDNKFFTYEKEGDDWIYLKEFETYSEAEKYLENRKKLKISGKLKKAEPLPCYKFEASYYDDAVIREAKITSIDPSGSYSLQVWVVENKRRSKERLDDLYKFSKKNKEIFEKIISLEKEIKKLEEEKEKFINKEVKKHFQEKED